MPRDMGIHKFVYSFRFQRPLKLIHGHGSLAGRSEYPFLKTLLRYIKNHKLVSKNVISRKNISKTAIQHRLSCLPSTRLARIQVSSGLHVPDN